MNDQVRLTIYSQGYPFYWTTWGQLKETYPIIQDSDFDQLKSQGCDYRIYLTGDAYASLN